MIDLHCHLLPGLDDGPDDFTSSIQMVEELYSLGFRTLVATPHFSWGGNRLSFPMIRDKLLQLGDKLTLPRLRILFAAEHFSGEVAELLQKDALLCFARKDTFLMEFPLTGFPFRLDELLFLIQVKQKVPVIAHVERYPDVQRDPNAVEQLKQRGCYLLVNLSGLAGAWTREAQQVAKSLIKKNLVDAVSSDLHAPAEIESIKLGLEILRDLVDPEQFSRLTKHTPAQIAGLVDNQKSC